MAFVLAASSRSTASPEPAMKTQTWRRDARLYPWQTSLQLRGADIDTERHINNVAVKGLHAEARQRFQLERFAGTPPWFGDLRQLRPVQLVSNFLAVTHYPEDVQAGLRLLHTDAQQSIWATALFQHGECVGVQESRLSAWADDLPVPFDAAERAGLAIHEAGVGAEQGVVSTLPPQSIGGGLRPEDYPAGQFISVRYGDRDAHWCLSEHAQLRAVEQMRSSALFGQMADAGVPYNQPGGLAVLMASKRVEFLRLCRAPERIEARVALARLGGSSLDLAIALFDQHGCFARADGVSVFVDPLTQRPQAVPAHLREALQRLQPLPA